LFNKSNTLLDTFDHGTHRIKQSSKT